MYCQKVVELVGIRIYICILLLNNKIRALHKENTIIQGPPGRMGGGAERGTFEMALFER